MKKAWQLNSAMFHLRRLNIADSHHRKICESSVGIMFLGGLNADQHPKLEKNFSSCIATELLLSPNNSLLRPKNLSIFFSHFRDTCKRFGELYTDCRIVTMLETRETVLARIFGVIRRSAVVSSVHSSLSSIIHD